MEKKVAITIDGRNVQAPVGMNLIEAGELAGVHIPNLCYLKGMKGIGACRLCLVEIEGMKAPIIACNTKVKEGMIINTKTEKVTEIRKFVIDLILSMHPLDCMTCTKAGACNLQKYAYDFGLKETTFSRKKFGYPTDEANPFIKRDPDYCLLCGRCVRTCREQGTNVLDFMGRGIESKVVTANDKPMQESGCTFCGSCLDTCPVNALLESDALRKAREWELQKEKSTCILCGNGCDITVSTKDGRVQKIRSGGLNGSVENYICAYGRFGFDCIEAETRVTSPMKREGGQLKETTWEDALSLVADRLAKAGNDAGFITVAGIANEDAFLVRELASTVVKTKNYDTTMSLYGNCDSFRNSQSAEIDSADVIVLVGLAPSQWQRILPALDAAIRRRVDRGAKLIVINSASAKIAEVAELNFNGDEIATLKAIAKGLVAKGMHADNNIVSVVADAAVTEETEKAAALIAAANEPLIFAPPSLFSASANIALMKGKVVSIGLESNAAGVCLMGLTTEGKTYNEMVRDGMKMIYAIGEVPLNERPSTDFLVVQNSHLTELARQADVVLPSAAFLEAKGTIIDYLGRLKYLAKVIEPQGDAKSHADIFIALAKALGADLKAPSEADVKRAAGEKPKLTSGSFERIPGFEVQAADFVESINASVINGSRLLWLKETEKSVVV